MWVFTTNLKTQSVLQWWTLQRLTTNLKTQSVLQWWTLQRLTINLYVSCFYDYKCVLFYNLLHKTNHCFNIAIVKSFKF